MVDRPNKPGALAVSHDITHATGVSIESDRVKVLESNRFLCLEKRKPDMHV